MTGSKGGCLGWWSWGVVPIDESVIAFYVDD